MSKLNEKLAASVKATGSRAATAKPPVKAKPAATAAKTAADKAVVKTPGTPEPGASGSDLFPSRVWPD